MRAGAILALIGGILSLFTVFLLSFYQIEVIPGVYLSGSGLGLLMSVGDVFTLATYYGQTIWLVLEVVFLICIFGGVLSIIGLKVRALAIIGGIFSIFIAVFHMLVAFGALPAEFAAAMAFFATDPALAPIPLHVGVGQYLAPGGSAGLGIYLLLGGGVLSFVGGVLPRD